jgi:hypothetical protein
MISVVDRNDREELTSVYEVGLYAILSRKLVQCQDSREHAFVLKSFLTMSVIRYTWFIVK